MSRKAATRRHKERELTLLEKRFVSEYTVDWQGGPALKRAGSTAEFVDQQAYEMLRKPHIANAIAARVALLNEKCAINKQWVMTELALQYRAASACAAVVTKGRRNTTEAKLAVECLEKLGRHVDVNAFRHQIGLGNPDGSAFDYDALTDEEQDDLERLLSKAALGDAVSGGSEGGPGTSTH
jgi:hypothetical protein